MSRLIRLYPPAWRDQYGDEFADLLAERPPSLVQRLDIVRGALDAWVHPQLARRTARQAPEASHGGRLAGAATIVGGGLWIAAGAAMFMAPMNWDLGYKESQVGVFIVVAAMAVTAVAAIAGSRSLPVNSRYAGIAAAVMLLGAALTAMPWPILILGFFGYVLAAAAYGAILALSPGRMLGGLLAIGALIVTSMNTEDERALLTIPIGLAWMAVGAAAVWRVPVRPSEPVAGY
jgi:hypothetical protein